MKHGVFKFLTFTTFVVVFTTAAQARPPRYHVRQGGTGDGSDWLQAGGDLQTAIETVAHAGGGEVWVAAGTYLPSSWPNGGTTDREKHFSLRNGVRVFGGFPALGNPGMVDRDPPLYPTLCSGNLGLPEETADNAYHVFHHPAGTALDATALLDGVTITAGNANGSGARGRGAGMANLGSSPSLVRCVFRSNTASLQGGGIYQFEGGPSVDHCVFHDNTSATTGGGICNETAQTRGSHLVFEGNSAPLGAGVSNIAKSQATFVSCTFHGNPAATAGGGLHSSGDSATALDNSILWGDSNGEVVDASGAVSTLRSCFIQGGWGGAGGDNSGDDPGFAQASVPQGADGLWATSDDGLRLGPASAAIDAGNLAWLPADIHDLDLDGDTSEPVPFDLRSRERVAGKGLDPGAYELQRPTATFVLGSHGTRTGGGALVQHLPEGANAVAPTLAVEFGWTFTGWDQPLENLVFDRTITALYVPTFAAGGICHVRVGYSGNGSSWAQAAGNVQQAIDVIAAAGGGQVWIAEGTFFPTSWPNGGSAPREKHFTLRNGVKVLGGFPASGDPGLTDRNPPAHPTLLSADPGATGDPSDNGYHVFWHPGSGLDASARLDGVVITGANADQEGGHEYGGGMFNQGGAATLVGCVFTANSARSQGGALYLGESTSQVVNCVFTGNFANEGGALFIYRGAPVLANCLFTGNTSFNGTIHTYDTGTPRFVECTLAHNTAGGGLQNNQCAPVLDNCIVWGNTPSQFVGDPATTTLNHCVFQGEWSGPGSGNSAANPLFADPADPDGPDNRWATSDDGLQPGAGGPAIDGGSSGLLPPDLTDIDADGNTAEPLPLDLARVRRVRGARPDCGAYETRATLVYHVLVGGTGEGLTWDDPMGDPQTAIEAAFAAGDSQVWIAAGTYLPSGWPNGGTLPREKHFALRNGVKAYGGFPTMGDPGLGDRNPAAFPVILSGDTGTSGDPSDNVYHVFQHADSNLDASARLDGVTIAGGRAFGGGSQRNGGGMYNRNSSPTLVRCVFLLNGADFQGGGLFLDDSSSMVVDCVFDRNQGTAGGGCFVYDNTPVFHNCVFSNNGSVAGGAAFLYQPGQSTFVNCTFFGNTGTSLGGAIFNDSSGPFVRNSIFWANSPDQVHGIAALQHCLVQGGWGGTGGDNVNANPLFTNAADPDGLDNRWATVDDGLRLTLPSPAINGGDPGFLPPDAADVDGDADTVEALPLDFIGIGRAIDGIPEIGACEFQPGVFSIAYWRTLHFSAADRADPAKEATVWGNEADPEGDHMPNCGEYLLLLDPNVCDSPVGRSPVIERFGSSWLQFTYTQATDRPGVSHVTLYSADLTPGSWQSTTALGFPTTLVAETATTRTWEILVPATGAKGFIRMGFTMSP